MKNFVVLIALLLGCAAVHAEDRTVSQPDGNIMEVVTFLNANHLSAGEVRYEMSEEPKRVSYFDAEDRLVRRVYLNEHNQAVTEEYDNHGHVISEIMFTEAHVRNMGSMGEQVQLLEEGKVRREEDPATGTIRQFHPEGWLMSETTRDASNSQVSTTYDQEGRVLSIVRWTEEYLRAKFGDEALQQYRSREK